MALRNHFSVKIQVFSGAVGCLWYDWWISISRSISVLCDSIHLEICLQTRRSVKGGKDLFSPARWLNSHYYSLQTKMILCLWAFSQVAPSAWSGDTADSLTFPSKQLKALLMGEPLAQHLLHLAILPSSTLERTALQNRSLSVPTAKQRTLIRIMPSRSLLSLPFPSLSHSKRVLGMAVAKGQHNKTWVLLTVISKTQAIIHGKGN